MSPRTALGSIMIVLLAGSTAAQAADDEPEPAWKQYARPIGSDVEPSQAEPGDAKPSTDEAAHGSQVDEQEPEEDSEQAEEEELQDFRAPRLPFAVDRRAEVEASLGRTLADPKSSFCTAQHAKVAADPYLCSLSHLPARQRCPGLAQACAAGAAAAPQSRISPAWGGVADLAFWLVLLALGVGLLVTLLRYFAGGSAMLQVRTQRTPPEPASTRMPSAPRPAGEADVARLWALAERAAGLAHFDEAVAALQAAFIHALRVTGKLHVNAAQTNGDYLRALRPEPDLQVAAREVFRAVEAVQFGGVPANDALYRRLFARVQPVVTHALSALLLFVVCFSQANCAQGLDSQGEAGHGLGVLTRLLREQQTTVRQRIRALDVIEPEVAAILVDGDQTDEAWAKLVRFASRGGMLIVTSTDDQLETAARVRSKLGSHSGKLELDQGLEAGDLYVSTVASHWLSLVEPDRPRDRVYASAEKGPFVVERSYGAGSVLIFADDEFLSNASLSLGDNAYFAVSLLRHPGEVLEIVGPWTGGGADSTLSSLTKAGLGTLLAQLALLAALFGWYGGVAFGSRRDAVVLPRRAFRDHVLALGDSYRRARATRYALATYGSWLVDRLRERLSPQQPVGLIDLAGRIAARVSESEADVVRLLTAARDAQEQLEAARPATSELVTLDKLENLTLRAGGSK